MFYMLSMCLYVIYENILTKLFLYLKLLLE